MDALSSARQQSFDVNSAAIPDAACANALPAGTRLQGFEVLSPLGQGGFSIVYKAMDTALQRPVAVKEYMPSSFASRTDSSQVILRSQRHKSSFDAGLSSFIEEARLLAQFKHPSLVEVLSFWEENGTAYMAMPLYSGKTLRQTLRDHPRCANEALLKGWIAPVLDVLEILHGQQVFHRDIAPDNIIIQPDGSPVLLDLGSARKVATDNEHAPTVVVKAGYAPIEQYAEDKSVPQGPWTDIYALGALLYYAVTGRPPSASVSRMMKDSLALLSEQQPEGYSKGFLAAIDHALALQPADRPQSISALREALDIQNIPASPVSLAPQARTGTAASYDDDEKTVILSAQELELLLSGEGRPQAPASNDEYDDLFDPPAERAADAHSFADMEELLNPSSAPAHGRLSVPGSRVEPTGKTAAATPDQPEGSGQGKRSGQGLMLAAGIACVLLIGGVLAAVMLPGQGELGTGELAVTDRAQLEPTPVTPVITAPMEVEARSAAPDTVSSAVEAAPVEASSVGGSLLPVDQQPGVATPPVDLDPVLAIETGSSVLAPSPEIVTVQLDRDAGVDGAVRNPPAVQPQAQAQAQAQTPPAPRVSASNRAQPARPATPVARAPEATTAIATGKIALNILPWGEVWVDGTLKGVTPPLRTLDLPVGRRNIEIRNPGFASLTHSINVTAQTTPEIVHEFISSGSHRNLELTAGDQTSARVTPAAPLTQPQPRVTEQPRAPARSVAPAVRPAAATEPTAFGYTEIRVRPWAEVWVNGERKGVAPPLNELRLPEGSHTVEFRNPDYPTVRRAVKVSSAARSTLVQFFD